jgi:hypothetical protein
VRQDMRRREKGEGGRKEEGKKEGEKKLQQA